MSQTEKNMPKFSDKKEALAYYYKHIHPTTLREQCSSNCCYYSVKTAVEVALGKPLTKKQNATFKEYIKDCPVRGEIFMHTLRLFNETFPDIPVYFQPVTNSIENIKKAVNTVGPVLCTIVNFDWDDKQSEIISSMDRNVFNIHACCCVGNCNINGIEYLVFKDTNSHPVPTGRKRNPFQFLNIHHLDHPNGVNEIWAFVPGGIKCLLGCSKMFFAWCYSVNKIEKKEGRVPIIESWWYPLMRKILEC